MSESSDDDFLPQVENQTTVEDSVTALLTGIAVKARQRQGNPEKVQSFLSNLESSARRWADAVVKNTGAATRTSGQTTTQPQNREADQG